MAKGFSLEQILPPGPRKPRKGARSRAERLAMAPTPPTAIQVRYAAALNSLLDGLRRATLDTLAPLFTQATGVTSLPDLPTERVGVKQDTADYVALLGRLQVRLSSLTEEPTLIALVSSIATDIDKKNARDLSRILQIDLSTDNVLRTYLTQFIRENVQLIRSVSFEALGSVEDLVRRSQSGQMRVEDLRDSLLQSFDVSKSRASLIARDQTLKANADLTQVRQQRTGITEYIWTSSRDERVRGKPGGKYPDTDSDHWSLDGTRQSWLSPPVTNPKTGARNHPGRDFQCRCVAIPVVDGLLEGL